MALTLVTTSGTGTAATAAGADAPGIGNALAETVKIDPRAGGLSLGITTGRSIAGHQNSVAQASSQSIDLGIIGTTLAAEGCDGGDPTLPADKQPQPLQVDSREEGAAAGETKEDNGFVRFARATTEPYGEAITTTAPFGVQGAVDVGSAVARTTSGLHDGVRAATATVDVSSITLAGVLGGVVKLDGLHWEASFPSTGDAKPTGSFSIGHLTIAGTPVPTTNPLEALAAVNDVLKSVGLELGVPTMRMASGLVYVDPLRISVVPNANRDAIFAKILAGVQPIRQNLFDALIAQDCSNATYITIFDIALGSISGAGAFNLLVGGVQATSGEALLNSFNLGGSGRPLTGNVTLPANTNTTPSYTTGSGGSRVTTPSGSGGNQTAAGDTPVTNGTQQVAATKPKGKRGGALAGVGLAGLLLLAAVAEGDRRKMRAAQRAITFDD